MERMLVAQLRLVMICLIMTVFAGCAGNSSGVGAGSTQVTIGLGQSVLTGALAAPGVIPANVQSFSVSALDATGQRIAGPVVATLPQTTVTLNVPNGNGIVFELLAYDAANGFGKIIYRGNSQPQSLNGQAVNVAVQLNLEVTITASSLQTGQGGSITLNGFVAGATPPATSPLLWTANGGILGTPSANGASILWTAPNTAAAAGQTYVINAKIDPASNPQQNQNVFASVNVLVATQVNTYGFAMSGNTFSVNGSPVTVDSYGNASNAQALAGSAMSISFGFRDYTGAGATTYTPAFKFDIRENNPGLRRAIGTITPVNVTTLASGEVSISVPANATLNYTATSAAGTTVIASSTNGLANTITTSTAGVVTLDVNQLLRTIANRSSASMNIFSTAGQFSYEIGFDLVDIGHENPTATGLDSLFDIGLNTSTRGVKGNMLIQ